MLGYLSRLAEVPSSEGLKIFGHNVSEVAQIIFFLMGAMALVELIDSHRGFKIITDRITTKSHRKMLWIIAFVTFFLSAVLDNLTTTILMVSLLRKLVPNKQERFFVYAVLLSSPQMQEEPGPRSAM